MPRILIVDDEWIILNLLKKILEGLGYDTTQADSGEAALRILQTERFDLMITDIKMLPVDGMELFRKTRKTHPEMSVIILTAHGTIGTAIEAAKGGVFDYIAKPFKLDELLLTVRRALEYENADVESPLSDPEDESPEKLDGIIARSVSMRKVCELIERVAPTHSPVLVCGEDGTGKELVGRALHRHSPRKNNPFTTTHCAALSASLLESELFGRDKDAVSDAASAKTGLFEDSEGGTLFLHEINALSLDLQARLLDVLQNKQICRVDGSDPVTVDVRIVAAANQPLEPLVEQGAFLRNLYARLGAIQIDIPPLRHRLEDVLPLVNYFLRKALGSEAELPVPDRAAREILDNYAWPGNVSELEDAIRHTLPSIQDGVFTREMLPVTMVEEVEEGLGSGAISRRREQFKGRALKAFLHEKSQELIDRPAGSPKQNQATKDDAPAAG